MTAATPGQALSPDPADFAYHVRATAFNVLTGKMAGDERHVPRSERDAIARAVVDAVEPLIRADERAVAAQEPQPGRPTTRLEDAMLRSIDGLNDLIRDMLQSLPNTADEQQWRDRAGALGVHDPDGQPYRAYTEEDI